MHTPHQRPSGAVHPSESQQKLKAAAATQEPKAPAAAVTPERKLNGRPPLEPPWAYSPPEARLAGVSERTVWSWIAAKKVHAVRVGGVTRVGAASLRKLLGLAS